jgi:CRP-like cAMP-binding protein
MKIYDINDTSNYFFIINKGSVNLEKNENNRQHNENSHKKTFGPWESFGEISFYNGKARNEIMVANDYAELYAIDSESFRELLKRNNEIILKEKYNFLNNISIFESLDKISKYNVAQKLKKREFTPNTKIIKKGEIGEKLYIIKEGIVSCRIGMKEIRKLSNNEYFGQNAILMEVKRGADIITLQKCICYEISKYNVAQKLKKREFNPNTKIITKGEIGETLYIIKEGIVSCRIGMKEIRKLSNNEYFGLNAILMEVKEEQI